MLRGKVKIKKPVGGLVAGLILACAVVYGQKKNDVLPVVNITSPVNGAAFTAPATITISVNATDSDGTIKKVEFFAGGSMLGSLNSPPYTFTWSHVAAGSYPLTARATDDDNAKTTSSAVTITVTAAPADPKSVSGQWSSLINFPNPKGCSGCAFLPIHMHLLPNGKILMTQDDNDSGARGSGTDTIAYVWDIATNSLTQVNNTTTDVFCSGHAFLPNGTLLVAGGHNGSDSNGTITTNLFNFVTNSWMLSPSHAFNIGQDAPANKR